MRLIIFLSLGFLRMLMNSIIKTNTNTDYLYPEFWAQSFQSLNVGEFNLQNLVSRDFDSQVASFGTKVNVPLAFDFGDADDFVPGSAIGATSIAQEEAEVNLNLSKRKTINLTAKELSLSPYDLIQNYGVGMVKSLLLTVNKEIYKEALKAKHFIDACAGISEDFIVSAGTKLSNLEVGQLGRVCVASPDVMGALKKIDAFQAVDNSGQDDIMKDGLITRRMGFNFYENNAIAKYTPFDCAGSCAAADLAATVLVVSAFNDDAGLVRIGDKLTVAGDTTIYTVTSTTLTGGDTTGIGIYPALAVAIAAPAVVTITPVQSALCFVPSAMALAARSYGVLPEGIGVKSSISNYNGLPVRFSVFHDGILGLNVQADILFGTKLVHQNRIVRILEDL